MWIFIRKPIFSPVIRRNYGNVFEGKAPSPLPTLGAGRDSANTHLSQYSESSNFLYNLDKSEGLRVTYDF